MKSMNYTLYGSKTSPFVRRIRILLEGIPYEFKEMDIFGRDSEELKAINPVNQIPVLKHGDKTIWDSRVIFNYLNGVHGFKPMSTDDENRLTAIDGAMGSAVSLLLMKRSGIDVTSELMYVKRQRERIESILAYLERDFATGAFETWDFHSISLYCFLDWGTFRELIDISCRRPLVDFLDAQRDRPIVKETQIPKG